MPSDLSPFNSLGINTTDKEALTISSGDITPKVKLVIVAAESGTADNLDGIVTTNIPAGSGDADGAELLLMADAGDTITIRHNQNAAATKNILTDTGADIAMTGNMVLRLLYNIALDTNGAWVVSEVLAPLPKRSIVLSAAGGAPTTTAGCATAVKVEESAQLDDWALDFDATTKEYAFWKITMPANYDGGTIDAEFTWFTTTGDVTKDARWGLQCRGLADGSSRSTALGTAQEVTDAADNSANTERISAATSAITPGGVAAGGNTMHFVAYRNPPHADDDLATDARLTQILITYTTDAISD